MKVINEIIKEIGKELNIKVTFLSDAWAMVLEKDNKKRYITGYQFDLNGHGIGKLLDDKGLFYELLKYLNIPIIDHYVIYCKYNKEDVLKYFKEHNNEIIVKGCLGNSGLEVFKVNNEEDLFKVMDKLFLGQPYIALCPYYHIKNEYRVIILNNEIKLIYGKIRPKIIGDGKKTIKELAQEYDEFYIENEDKIDNPNYIPKLNEEIELTFKFNLFSGAKSFMDIDPDLKKQIGDLALRVTKEAGIMFTSVDVINTIDNRLLVMEANSGIVMNNFIKQHKDGYRIAYDIYKEAVIKMFE